MGTVEAVYNAFQVLSIMEEHMETRVALIGIIVENTDSVERLNGLLHEYGSFIIGRMGIPHRERHMNIISIVMDAPQEVISALSGKVGMLPGVNSKVIYGKKQ